MSFMKSEFYKELSRGPGSDVSETSAINPEELAKMLQVTNTFSLGLGRKCYFNYIIFNFIFRVLTTWIMKYSVLSQWM